MKKILIVSTFIPPITGGAEQVAYETAVRLSKYKDLDVHILTTGNKKRYKKDGITIHEVPNHFAKELYYSFNSKPISDLLRKEKFKIVHSHMVLPWGFVLRNYKFKKVITCHGSDVYKPGFIRKILVQLSLNKADLVITPSSWLGRYVRSNYKKSCVILNNGIDTKKFRPLNLKRKKNVVLFVGRFIEIKGVLDLLNVAKQLPQYEFWFVGDGPLKDKINLPNTKNLGFKNKDELIKLYNKATIVVFPSHRENFPIVGLEAMSCGSPIIATKLGFSEIIDDGHNGMIIDDKDELKDAICFLMNKPKIRKKFEINSRKKSIKYDWSNIIKKYYAIYRNKK